MWSGTRKTCHLVFHCLKSKNSLLRLLINSLSKLLLFFTSRLIIEFTNPADKSIFYKVPYFVISSKEELSKAVGLNNISSIGIKSIGGANKIINMMKED